jgi:hypothetical protein
VCVSKTVPELCRVCCLCVCVCVVCVCVGFVCALSVVWVECAAAAGGQNYWAELPSLTSWLCRCD